MLNQVSPPKTYRPFRLAFLSTQLSPSFKSQFEHTKSQASIRRASHLAVLQEAHAGIPPRERVLQRVELQLIGGGLEGQADDGARGHAEVALFGLACRGVGAHT